MELLGKNRRRSTFSLATSAPLSASYTHDKKGKRSKSLFLSIVDRAVGGRSRSLPPPKCDGKLGSSSHHWGGRDAWGQFSSDEHRTHTPHGSFDGSPLEDSKRHHSQFEQTGYHKKHPDHSYSCSEEAVEAILSDTSHKQTLIAMEDSFAGIRSWEETRELLGALPAPLA